MQKLNKLHKKAVKEKHVEKNETNSMKTQIAVISAILGTIILSRGVWQYIHERTQPLPRAQSLTSQRRTQPLTREQLQRHTRIQQYLQEQRARERRIQLQREQERRLTQRLRQLHNSTIRV